MESRFTQLALVVVFGLIVLLGTLLVFQAWYNSTAPTEAEIQAVVHKVTKMDVDAEVTALNNSYNTSKAIEVAGRIIMVIETIFAVLILLYMMMQSVSEPMDVQDRDDKVRRAYQGR